jgi:aminopeptidase-like protein
MKMRSQPTNTTEIKHYLEKLFPITRSLSGDGNKKTLEILSEIFPIKIKKYPSGKKVFDWKIPEEWNIKDGWIKNSKGEKIVDFKKNNLHVVGYSIPVHKKVGRKEMLSHLHFLKDLPEAIPYKTSYYKKYWGFCVSYNDFVKNFSKDDIYEVFIDSEHKNGFMLTGEIFIKGKKKDEILISTYICHPSLGNDNLSGMVTAAFLARELSKMKLNNSYRILFLPETIGSIAYLANNTEHVKKNIRGALVVTCTAGPGKFGFKETFLKNSFIDKAIVETFEEKKIKFVRYSFEPQGSDERQYSSVGFRIPSASIFKDKYYEYPYYHTSLDNLNFISPENLERTLGLYFSVIKKIDKHRTFVSTKPFGEVFLSKYKLYPTLGTTKSNVGINPTDTINLDAIRWLLFYGDGKHSLSDVAEETCIEMTKLEETFKILLGKKLLKQN